MRGPGPPPRRPAFWAALLAATLLNAVAIAQDGDRARLPPSRSADPVALWEAIKRGLDRLSGAPEAPPPARTPEPSITTLPPPATTPPPPSRVRRTTRGPDECARSTMTQAELMELQALLNEILGEADGPGSIDGVCGPRTLAAIRAFGLTQNFPAASAPDAELLAAVREVGATVANRAIFDEPLKEGDPALWRPRAQPLPARRETPAAPGPQGDPALSGSAPPAPPAREVPPQDATPATAPPPADPRTSPVSRAPAAASDEAPGQALGAKSGDPAISVR
jgi:peptidoglycan hydrolase-like protein with peptidoglycan-binding domain